MFGIKKAYCLCLDKRKEHWLDLKNQCESKGLEFNRFLAGDGKLLDSQEYDRVDIEDAPIDNWGYGGHETNTEEEIRTKKIKHCNAFLSHQAMAKKALEDGDEKVLFLEDDSYFTERFDKVVKETESEIEKINYDMLYLGWWIGDEGDEFNNDIERIWKESESIGVGTVNRIGGLHGVIISRKILDIITRLEPINPIDSQLSRFFHDKIESFFLAPKIIHDKGIFSECEQSTTTRSKL
jgi:hypothetical protein